MEIDCDCEFSHTHSSKRTHTHSYRHGGGSRGSEESDWTSGLQCIVIAYTHTHTIPCVATSDGLLQAPRDAGEWDVFGGERQDGMGSLWRVKLSAILLSARCVVWWWFKHTTPIVRVLANHRCACVCGGWVMPTDRSLFTADDPSHARVCLHTNQ